MIAHRCRYKQTQRHQIQNALLYTNVVLDTLVEEADDCVTPVLPICYIVASSADPELASQSGIGGDLSLPGCRAIQLGDKVAVQLKS